MKSVNIKLNLMTDGAKFVQIVGAYPYDMDLRSGRHVVDAKSILGIFSLDLSKPIDLNIHADGAALDNVMQIISKYTID